MNSINLRKIGSGPSLLLLHGWAFDANVWKEISPSLSNYYTVYAPDLPGHGDTAMMGYQQFFEQLLSVLPKQFYICGWSLGGLYAIQCAILYPERVLKLINTATSPCFVAKPNWPGIAVSVLERFYHRYRSDSDKTIKEFVALQSRPKKNISNIALPKKGSDLESNLNFLTAWDLRDALKSLKMPVHWLFGRRDSIVPHSLADTLRNHYPAVNVTIWRNAAHMPFISEPENFIQYIREVD